MWVVICVLSVWAEGPEESKRTVTHMRLHTHVLLLRTYMGANDRRTELKYLCIVSNLAVAYFFMTQSDFRSSNCVCGNLRYIFYRCVITR
jgi:hypothetical protein